MTISYAYALHLLRQYVEKSSRIHHSIGVSKIAHRIAETILDNNPYLDIDPEKVRLAGLLHDIGYGISAHDHELHTIEILKAHGLDDIAEITTHGYLYEYLMVKGVKRDDLLPSTIENKIVIYADFLFNQRRQTTTMEERIRTTSKLIKDDPERLAAWTQAVPRFYELKEELTSLM
ncbi:MAG: HD domain-containing protein [Candidatus Woesearchaeota archaeon]